MGLRLLRSRSGINPLATDTSQNCSLTEHPNSNAPPFSASQSDKSLSHLLRACEAPYRPSPVPAVTLCNNCAQACSHKCYRSAHTSRDRAFTGADGTSKYLSSDGSYRRVATSFSGVIEQPFNFRHGNCSVITKPRLTQENDGNNKSLRLRPSPALCEEIPR